MFSFGRAAWGADRRPNSRLRLGFHNGFRMIAFEAVKGSPQALGMACRHGWFPDFVNESQQGAVVVGAYRSASPRSREECAPQFRMRGLAG